MNMYKIVAIIEKGTDGRFAITSSQSFGKNHFGGFGETIEEAKADFRESVEDCRDLALADGECVPEEYQVTFRYDMPSSSKISISSMPAASLSMQVSTKVK